MFMNNSPSSLLRILTAHCAEFSQEHLLAFSFWCALPTKEGECRQDEADLVLSPCYPELCSGHRKTELPVHGALLLKCSPTEWHSAQSAVASWPRRRHTITTTRSASRFPTRYPGTERWWSSLPGPCRSREADPGESRGPMLCLYGIIPPSLSWLFHTNLQPVHPVPLLFLLHEGRDPVGLSGRVRVVRPGPLRPRPALPQQPLLLLLPPLLLPVPQPRQGPADEAQRFALSRRDHTVSSAAASTARTAGPGPAASPCPWGSRRCRPGRRPARSTAPAWTAPGCGTGCRGTGTGPAPPRSPARCSPSRYSPSRRSPSRPVSNPPLPPLPVTRRKTRPALPSPHTPP